MAELLWLVPCLPLLGFLILATLGSHMPRRMVSIIGPGSVLLSAITLTTIASEFIKLPEANRAIDQMLWHWISIGAFNPSFGFHLDSLSLVMCMVVAWVGFLIHLYSTEYMADDKAFSRFFAYMNLFVCAMLVLLLGDNLLMLFLGWEGVGLCSYLLIGFWYSDPQNGAAARKAFIVTRIGDTAMTIGVLYLFTNLQTLNIQELLIRASSTWTSGSFPVVFAAAMLLGGALGKSAQLPLQTWLPDAMAGPTPVSALIHAATMVTAGVYLIARTHTIFELAPDVMFAVALIGLLTMLYSGFSAMVQYDIKRVLAYSTISQIGFMFLALGVGAFSAAIFHFMTHAIFKALLFLGAGAVIMSLHHEQNIFRMGGLRRELPITFWTFLIGGAALAGFPLITAGFYSKEMILTAVYGAPRVAMSLWIGALIAAFMTAMYTARLILIVFFGQSHGHRCHPPSWAVHFTLIVLAVFALCAGFVETPPLLGGITSFSHFVSSSLPVAHHPHLSHGVELALLGAAILAALSGIVVGYLVYGRKPTPVNQQTGLPAQSPIQQFFLGGWGFDTLYDTMIIRPYVFLANVNHKDFVDMLYTMMAAIVRALNRMTSIIQTGQLRWYTAFVTMGAVILLAWVVLP